MRRAPAGSLVAAFALAFVVSPAVAASPPSADTYFDQIGDAAYFPVDPGPGDGVPTVDPTRRVGDIRAIRAVHGDSVVRVALYYRSLPSAGLLNKHHFEFKTPATTRYLRIEAAPGNWKGTATFTNIDGTKRSCSGLTTVISYSTQRVIVEVPRSCLGNPAFLRVGALGVSSQTERTYVDDAYSAGAGYSGLSYGPAIHH